MSAWLQWKNTFENHLPNTIKKSESSIQGYILSRLSFFEHSVPVSVVAFFLYFQEPLRNSNTSGLEKWFGTGR